MVFQSPEVLNEFADTEVTFHAKTFQERDGALRSLEDAMFGATMDPEN